ncbi:MAG: 50S ribosomal protein L23 [Deltaproteobacteria bacterium]|nr:50S ribosomal protein L23 [Deltaproteobacteria bacterium]MBW2085592.1 50S ribosomal protein L23 [Deltaproteobacteria bacterium]
MTEPSRAIIKPLITEKSTLQKERDNQIAFVVDRRANKIEIGRAVEQVFKVKVTKVRTINMRGKKKRLGQHLGKRSDWKKAIVTLAPGEHIDFFEGV